MNGTDSDNPIIDRLRKWRDGQIEENDPKLFRRSLFWKLTIPLSLFAFFPMSYVSQMHFVGLLFVLPIFVACLTLILLWTANLVQRLRFKAPVKLMDALLPMLLIMWIVVQFRGLMDLLQSVAS